MSGTYTYPGLYIQELPSSTHTVQAAPTSIAAFIGYVNPWATAAAGTAFGAAVVLYSFTDYETNFGGMFSSGLVDPSLPQAVFQFFANGGSVAYVVGLQPLAQVSGGTWHDLTTTAAFTCSLGTSGANGILFTARQFADQVPMGLIISNPRTTVAASGGFDTFDVAITYGNTIETYRGVMIGLAAQANTSAAPDKKIGAVSSLVTVGPIGGGFGSTIAAAAATTYTFTSSGLGSVITTFNAADFLDVLQANTPLDQVEVFNLLLVPGVADNSVQSAALAFAERKLAFALLDPPATATLSAAPSGLTIDAFASSMPRSQNGAIYYPWLQSTDTVTGNSIQVAPSGFVAGVYASTDVSRGVWKAPAGMATAILNTTGPVASGIVTDQQHGELNITQAVNCLRQFASIGTVVFGARTLVGNNNAYAQSKYVPVRRMTLFLEQTLISSLRWVVFEPNADPLWSAITLSIESFLLGIWNQGGLQGTTPSQAFQVKCDSSTTTADDQANGIVNIVVAFAPLKPAEFVVIKIAQLAGQPTS
jgi:phage tail sheath protein FI